MTVTPAQVEFASPPFGLAPLTSFTLVRVEGAEGLYALRSTAQPVRLFLLDVSALGDAYRPSLTEGALAQVGAPDASAVRIFVVANPADDGVYVNLRAPVVVHRDTGCAAQVILEDQSHPLRAPLVVA